eukprot:5134902-Amphidinium_carterae.1
MIYLQWSMIYLLCCMISQKSVTRDLPVAYDLPDVVAYDLPFFETDWGIWGSLNEHPTLFTER